MTSEINEYRTTIKMWPEGDRPREKLIKNGPGRLTDAELLALLIGSGTGQATAVDLAKCLLSAHENLSCLSECSLRELMRLKGIGLANGSRLLAAFEIGRRIESGDMGRKLLVRSPEDVGRHYLPRYRHFKREVFSVLLLDGKNQVMRDVPLSEGTLNASLVHPREVFKAAVDHLAAAVILMHNHPSGQALPSEEDRQITRQILQAGYVMGIPVIDHIILAKDRIYSFAQSGLLDQMESSIRK